MFEEASQVLGEKQDEVAGMDGDAHWFRRAGGPEVPTVPVPARQGTKSRVCLESYHCRAAKSARDGIVNACKRLVLAERQSVQIVIANTAHGPRRGTYRTGSGTSLL